MKVSVICSNYNSMQWITQYLWSLNQQFLSEFEVVFVDANSSDGSFDVIQKFPFRKGITPLLFGSDKRISIYEAWNLGIKSCSGDYVVNYNTDDLLFPSALQTYMSYVTMHPHIDLIYSPMFTHDNHSPFTITNIRLWPSYSHDILKRMCICGPFPLVRRSAIQRVGYFNTKYRSSADYDMWLKLSFYGYKFLNIPEVIGSFYQRADSVSNTNLAANQADDREIQAKY